MALMGMPLDQRWTAVEAGFAFVMWTVRMVAVMLPSAAPVGLLFAALGRRSGRLTRTAVFVAGYLVLWGAFSAVAAALQWALQLLAVTNAAGPALGLFGAALAGAAGPYQPKPPESARLSPCPPPLSANPRPLGPGPFCPLLLGARHRLSFPC